jgi:hypothetical protein
MKCAHNAIRQVFRRDNGNPTEGFGIGRGPDVSHTMFSPAFLIIRRHAALPLGSRSDRTASEAPRGSREPNETGRGRSRPARHPPGGRPGAGGAAATLARGAPGLGRDLRRRGSRPYSPRPAPRARRAPPGPPRLGRGAHRSRVSHRPLAVIDAGGGFGDCSGPRASATAALEIDDPLALEVVPDPLARGQSRASLRSSATRGRWSEPTNGPTQHRRGRQPGAARTWSMRAPK